MKVHTKLGRPSASSAVAALIVASLLGGSARADDWASLGLGEGRGRLASERGGGRFDGGSWRHEWKSQDPLSQRALVASPAIGDGFVAFATQRNLVRVLAEADGRLIWEARVGGAVVASPAIWRGLVFVVGVNQRITALRLADGSVAWEKPLPAMAYASPVIAGGALFVATASPAPRLWRLDPVTGNVAWQAGAGKLEASALASVAVADGHVIVGELGGHYHSFAVADGAWQWTTAIEGRVGLSSPLVVGTRVYLLPGGAKAQLHALELATGQPVAGWPIDLPMPAADPGLGAARARAFVASSPAGDATAITFALRADDRFGTAETGEATSVLSQEQLFLVDPTTATIRWSTANGRLATSDPNALPAHELLPTPALYRDQSGALLIAASSSLASEVRVFPGSGDGSWSAALAGATRGSPSFANGRLVVATDAGTVESFLSGSNQPPRAASALLPRGDTPTTTTLHWDAAVDPEGQPVTYLVRVDDDGEVLRDWDLEASLPAGALALDLPDLMAGATYTFAVRARDPQGAFSAWSPPGTFRATLPPSVTIDDQPSPSLPAALAAAHPGSIIRLGPGRLDLTATLRLPPGVVLAGAGAHLTTLNAQGLPIGVAPGSGGELRQLTVSGGMVGVAIDAAIDVQLRNVILRDNSDAGLDVTATGSGQLVSATLVRNGTAVRAAGATRVRNALVTANTVGLSARAPTDLDGRFNDVFQNGEDYRGLTPSSSDLALAVTFPSADLADLRFQVPQPTTDRGDPADDFSREPLPNGGRINIGAFGNTEFAELSGLGGTDPAPGPGPSTGPATPSPQTAPPRPRHDDGGCAIVAGHAQSHGGMPLALAVAGLAWSLARRRARRP